MYAEAKKLYIIEEVLKISNVADLMDIEAVINKTQRAKSVNKPSAKDFLGLLTE